MTTTQLEQLKKFTIVVADTGDISSIAKYKPTDATTNPSLILASAEKYAHLVREAVEFSKKHISEESLTIANEKDKQLCLAVDKVCVNFGIEILKHVSGVVSTEVDARLSFDKQGSVLRAKRIIDLYEKEGISRDRVLIKLASTWEGFEAAKELKKEGIKCNLTLLFSFYQAVAAAEAGVELISPFVGRILDWYKANSTPEEVESYKNPANDPGVKSVQRIYNYYKKHGYETIVMGASFRTKGEVLELSGCDKLTIGPKFLDEMGENEEEVTLKLSAEEAKKTEGDDEKITLTEAQYRWEMCQDQMATDKLTEGIRNFAKDIVKLEHIIEKQL